MRTALLLLLSFSLACTSEETQPISDAGMIADAGPADSGGSTDGGGVSACEQPRLIEYVSVPLRDGKSLHGLVARPDSNDCVLPTVLIQTPYDIENFRSLFLENQTEAMPLFDSTDYNFVAVDWRGHFGSRDARTPNPPATQKDEDGYDSVEWSATQPWSDGKVGTWGVSALCGQQYRTANAQPPHLLAAVPIFCGTGGLAYRYVYPGGVIRREYVDLLDVIGFVGTKAVVEAHPFRDLLWRASAGVVTPGNIDVPMLVVAGWWDLVPLSSLESFEVISTLGGVGARDQHRLLIGSWFHFAAGGETQGAGRPLTTEELRYFDTEKRIQLDSLAFFDLHLRGLPGGAADWDVVRYDQVGDGWRGADAWPPAGVQDRVYYLHSDGRLSAQTSSAAEVGFRYDPTDPSPTIGGGTLSFDLTHGPASQAPVLARQGDHRVFVTDALAAPLELTGALKVTLDVSTTGQDTDFAVRVTDVDQTGDHLLIGEGIRRLKLRDGYDAPSPVVAGDRYTVDIFMVGDLAYTLASGHRLGLIVSSSNFPRFGRNPNDGEDFYSASPAPVAVTNTLFLDGSTRFTVSVAP